METHIWIPSALPPLNISLTPTDCHFMFIITWSQETAVNNSPGGADVQIHWYRGYGIG